MVHNFRGMFKEVVNKFLPFKNLFYWGRISTACLQLNRIILPYSPVKNKITSSMQMMGKKGMENPL